MPRPKSFWKKNSMADTPELILSDFISIKGIKGDVARLYSRFHSTEVFSILQKKDIDYFHLISLPSLTLNTQTNDDHCKLRRTIRVKASRTIVVFMFFVCLFVFFFLITFLGILSSLEIRVFHKAGSEIQAILNLNILKIHVQICFASKFGC